MRLFSRSYCRRGLAGAMTVTLSAAATVVALGLATPAAASDDFYTPPSPLPAGGNGDIVKSQPSKYSNATSTRIMYLSRDQRNQATPITGTVVVPAKAWTGPGPRPIVAYAPFTAGMGDQCATSKTMAGEGSDLVSGFQNSFIDALLGQGFAVAETDYQGLGTPGDHPYVMRAPEAHAVLDVLRAAQRLPGTGLAPDGPLGIAGYSEGGGASASAAELAATYAPELHIKGAYAGAAPADKAVLAKTLDGSTYAGFLAFALIGIQTAYPDSGILDLANPTGAQLFLEARQTCTLDAVLKFAGKNTSALTKDGRPVAAYLDQEPFRSIVAANKLGTVKPSFPVIVEHSTADDVIPYATGKQLAKDWCAEGADVQFKDIVSILPFFSHLLGMSTASGTAASWLADRFAGKPTASNCGSL
ncbi:lipase family protein [Amycolatopsis sp. NBC_00345]|uniref:lipase family protein n=1 Tax=Amycolatopsis sp. NBC_00345 TaxID=2975955 RepID=UPI002E26A7C5